MSLDLDARQRAMLQEMGVRLWLPTHAHGASPAPMSDPAPSALAPPPQGPSAQAGTSAALPRPRQGAPRAASAAPAAAASDAVPSQALVLHRPRPLFPDADPQQVPPALGTGWLLVAEGAPDADPLDGEAGRLLGNMLHALLLDRHPNVFLCSLSAASANAADPAPSADSLERAIASLQPSVILLMGLAATRAVLGRSEPLGQLRGLPFGVAGIPAVVTYDAPLLLRSPGLKPAAWVDLCRARALCRAAG